MILMRLILQSCRHSARVFAPIAAMAQILGMADDDRAEPKPRGITLKSHGGPGATIRTASG
jgi:hypothetical protein